MRHFHTFRWACAVVTAVGVSATAISQVPRPAPADPLEVAKAQQKVAEQKAEFTVLQAIENADKLANSRRLDPAVRTLLTAKQDVQLLIGISDATRTRLTTMLDAKLAAITGKAPAAKPTRAPALNPIELDPKGKEVKADQKDLLTKQATELKDVRDGLKAIEKYHNEKNSYGVSEEIKRLGKLYPNNPAVIELVQTGTMQDRLAAATAHYAESNKRWVANQMDINRSSLPVIGDVEFPSDWKEKSARRLEALRIKLTDKEKKIIETLDRPMSLINFQERPLEEALQDLSNAFDLPLFIDKKSLEDLGLDLKKGVTLQGKGLSGRTVLRSLLATQGLTFVVKDEMIQVVTVERSKTLLTTRAYYVGDLIKGVGPFSGLQWGPFINDQQSAANLAAVLDAIRKVDPLSWSGPETGGPGSVTFHAASQSIIVRNSAEVHFTLGNAIYGGKK